MNTLFWIRTTIIDGVAWDCILSENRLNLWKGGNPVGILCGRLGPILRKKYEQWPDPVKQAWGEMVVQMQTEKFRP